VLRDMVVFALGLGGIFAEGFPPEVSWSSSGSLPLSHLSSIKGAEVHPLLLSEMREMKMVTLEMNN